jgi:hypothetical protein
MFHMDFVNLVYAEVDTDENQPGGRSLFSSLGFRPLTDIGLKDFNCRHAGHVWVAAKISDVIANARAKLQSTLRSYTPVQEASWTGSSRLIDCSLTQAHQLTDPSAAHASVRLPVHSYIQIFDAVLPAVNAATEDDGLPADEPETDCLSFWAAQNGLVDTVPLPSTTDLPLKMLFWQVNAEISALRIHSAAELCTETEGNSTEEDTQELETTNVNLDDYDFRVGDAGRLQPPPPIAEVAANTAAKEAADEAVDVAAPAAGATAAPAAEVAANKAAEEAADEAADVAAKRAAEAAEEKQRPLLGDSWLISAGAWMHQEQRSQRVWTCGVHVINHLLGYNAIKWLNVGQYLRYGMQCKLHLISQVLSADEFAAAATGMRLDLELAIKHLYNNPVLLKQRLADLYENCVAKDEGLPYTQLIMLGQLFGLRLDVVADAKYDTGTKMVLLMALPSGAKHWVALERVGPDSWVGSDSLWPHPVSMTDANVQSVVHTVIESDPQLGLMLLRATDLRTQAATDVQWPAYSMEALRVATDPKHSRILPDVFVHVVEDDRPKRASDLHTLDCSRLRRWSESLQMSDRLTSAQRGLTTDGACVVNADQLLQLRSGSPLYHLRARVNESTELKLGFQDRVWSAKMRYIRQRLADNLKPDRADIDVVCTASAPGDKIPAFVADSVVVKKVIVGGEGDVDTVMLGPKGSTSSTMMITGGALYDLAAPRLQLKPKIVMDRQGSTWPNDALMREFEWLVSVITGEDVVLERESWTILRAAVGAVQQMHLDWDKKAIETILKGTLGLDGQFWERVYVMLYFPKGGLNIDKNGEIRLLKAGEMLLFDGYSYVHAAGPELHRCVRHHAVFTVRKDNTMPYYDIASNVQTFFVDDPTLAERAKAAGEVASEYYGTQVQRRNKELEERLKKNEQVSLRLPLQLAHRCALHLAGVAAAAAAPAAGAAAASQQTNTDTTAGALLHTDA